MQTSPAALLSNENTPFFTPTALANNTLSCLCQHIIIQDDYESYRPKIENILHTIYAREPDLIHHTHPDLKIRIQDRNSENPIALAWYQHYNKTLTLPIDSLQDKSDAYIQRLLQHEIRHDTQYKSGKLTSLYNQPLSVVDYMLAAKMIEAETAANDMDFIRRFSYDPSLTQDNKDNLAYYKRIYKSHYKQIARQYRSQSLTPTEIEQKAATYAKKEYMFNLMFSGFDTTWNTAYDNQSVSVVISSILADIQNNNIVDNYATKDNPQFIDFLAAQYKEYGFTAQDFKNMHQAIGDKEIDLPLQAPLAAVMKAPQNQPLQDRFIHYIALAKAYQDITYIPLCPGDEITQNTIHFIESIDKIPAPSELSAPHMHSIRATTTTKPNSLENMLHHIENNATNPECVALLTQAITLLNTKYPHLIAATHPDITFNIQHEMYDRINTPENTYTAKPLGEKAKIDIPHLFLTPENLDLLTQELYAHIFQNAQENTSKYAITGTGNEIIFNHIIAHAEKQCALYSYAIENNMPLDEENEPNFRAYRQIYTYVKDNHPHFSPAEINKETFLQYTFYHLQNPEAIQNGQYNETIVNRINNNITTIQSTPNAHFISQLAQLYHIDTAQLADEYTQFNQGPLQQNIAIAELYAQICQDSTLNINTKIAYTAQKNPMMIQIHKELRIEALAKAIVGEYPEKCQNPATRGQFFTNITNTIPHLPPQKKHTPLNTLHQHSTTPPTNRAPMDRDNTYLH